MTNFILFVTKINFCIWATDVKSSCIFPTSRLLLELLQTLCCFDLFLMFVMQKTIKRQKLKTWVFGEFESTYTCWSKESVATQGSGGSGGNSHHRLWRWDCTWHGPPRCPPTPPGSCEFGPEEIKTKAPQYEQISTITGLHYFQTPSYSSSFKHRFRAL